MMEAREIIKKINELKAELFSLESGIKAENAKVLCKEILNLKEGVGQGYHEGDCYAPTRYYSEIPGVKNIRWGNEDRTTVDVKVESPKGFLVPNMIQVGDETYSVTVFRSSNYSERVDY